MVQFDVQRRFQLGAFISTPLGSDAGEVAKLLAAETARGPRLSVRFNRVTALQRIQVREHTALDANVVAPVLSFSGPPVWRLELAPDRLDVHFDAFDYEDTSGKTITLAEICDRIVPNLARLSERGIVLTRLLLVFEGRSASAPTALADLARKLASAELQEDVAQGRCAELTVRHNQVAAWTLAGAPVQVNRIEQRQTYREHIASQPSRSIYYHLLDVNTSPDATLTGREAEIDEFFQHAAQWAEQRLAE